MSKPLYTLHLKKRNFKTKPFFIEIYVDGWRVGSVWSSVAKLKCYPNDNKNKWCVRDENQDVCIWADRLVFEEAK